MYSNNLLDFQESTTILNACTKNVWNLIEGTTYIDFSWDIKDDTYRSEHFSILLENTKSNSENISYWKLDKTKWDKFKDLCKENLTKNNNIDSAEY